MYRRSLLILTALLSIFLIFIFFQALKKDFNYSTDKLIGKKIGSFKVQSLNKDFYLTENQLNKNKYTLINFWASWCIPCRKEHNFLLKLNQKKGIDMIGINFKDQTSNAKSFITELGNPYDFLMVDESGKQSINFGVYGIPESILINKELKIIKKYIGPLSKANFLEISEIIKE